MAPAVTAVTTRPDETRRAPASAGLAERLLAGERAALARLITWAENADPRFARALADVYARVGRAERLGITGPPGAGKSTLVNELVRVYRAREETIGVLAVDPSSPFTGGALLGDRIRMEERTLDSGVFIRSMASRESHGGLARAAVDACDVMDAFGFDRVLLETVGVGQAEYDVVGAADTVVVVLCPGAGDGIQAMKAGLLEVADVLCVNKSDLSGADRLVRDLEEATHVRFRRRDDAWVPPVVSVSAGRSLGVEDLADAIERHRAHLAESAAGAEPGDSRLDARRRTRRIEQVRQVVDERLSEALWQQRGFTGLAAGRLAAGDTPYQVAEELFERVHARVLEHEDRDTDAKEASA